MPGWVLCVCVCVSVCVCVCVRERGRESVSVLEFVQLRLQHVASQRPSSIHVSLRRPSDGFACAMCLFVYTSMTLFTTMCTRMTIRNRQGPINTLLLISMKCMLVIYYMLYYLSVHMSTWGIHVFVWDRVHHTSLYTWASMSSISNEWKHNVLAQVCWVRIHVNLV